MQKPAPVNNSHSTVNKTYKKDKERAEFLGKTAPESCLLCYRRGCTARPGGCRVSLGEQGEKKRRKFGGTKPPPKPCFAGNRRGFVSFLSGPAPAGFHPRGSWQKGTRGHWQGLALRGALRAWENIYKIKTTKPPRHRLCRWSHQRPVITSLSPGLKSMKCLCQADKGPGAVAQGHPCRAKPSQSSVHLCACFPAKGSQKNKGNCFILICFLPTESLSVPVPCLSTLEEDLRSACQPHHCPQRLQGCLGSTQKSCSSPCLVA